VICMDVYNKESGYHPLFTECMRLLSSSKFEPISILLPQLDQSQLKKQMSTISARPNVKLMQGSETVLESTITEDE